MGIYIDDTQIYGIRACYCSPHGDDTHVVVFEKQSELDNVPLGAETVGRLLDEYLESDDYLSTRNREQTVTFFIYVPYTCTYTAATAAAAAATVSDKMWCPIRLHLLTQLYPRPPSLFNASTST